jgi:hypothetical protein
MAATQGYRENVQKKEKKEQKERQKGHLLVCVMAALDASPQKLAP